MRKIAVFAGFDSFFREIKISAAFVAKNVKRAEAEKAVEIFFCRRFMARKVLAFRVCEKFVMAIFSIFLIFIFLHFSAFYNKILIFQNFIKFLAVLNTFLRIYK